MQNEPTLYERVGGEPTFQRLVEAFYRRVEADEVLRPLFPTDMTAGKRWQMLFLMQYFGGPVQYVIERGHPRLRMRHSPFPIDQEKRDHWLRHMLAAVDEAGIQEPMRTTMYDYFEFASTAMINVVGVDQSHT
jgi:hemoglobin